MPRKARIEVFIIYFLNNLKIAIAKAIIDTINAKTFNTSNVIILPQMRWLKRLIKLLLLF